MRIRRGCFRFNVSRRKFLLASAALAGAQAASASHAASLLGGGPAAEADIASCLVVIETALEEHRKAKGIPGAALAIVSDDRVIFSKGFGVRGSPGGLPVTPDTLFSIGSDTKAFTAAAAMISVDDGRLSLDDSPKKYLSYFKLSDPEADARITIRDLLDHGSGLMRTDWPWFTGMLSREEAIRVAGLAKPRAKLGTTWQYQNVMYMAAGEVIGRANDSTWEQVVEHRLFTPLGMTASTTSIAEMRRSANFATGHERVAGTVVPARIFDRTCLGPAGAITSDLTDMARWLRLLLGRGEIEGKRLISERGFAEMTTRQIATGDGGGYGLGLFLNSRAGIDTVSHGGVIDGFNSHLFLVPERRLGFVLLTNIGSSELPKIVEDAVWRNLVTRTAETAAAASASRKPQDEAGRYVTFGFYLDVVFRDGRLHAVLSDQPEFPMAELGPRRYRFEPPAPEGFFLTFRQGEAQGGETAYLEQPGDKGNLDLRRLVAANPGGGPSAVLRELIGSYASSGLTARIEASGDFAVIILPDQPAYHLVEQADGSFVLFELGRDYRIAVERDAGGAVTGIVFKEPEGEVSVRRVLTGVIPLADITIDGITLDELMAKAVAVIGGEAALRRTGALRLVADYDFENMGMTGERTVTSDAGGTHSSVIRFFALGKEVGAARSDCAGTECRDESSFEQEVDKTGLLPDLDYASLLHWRTWWQAVTIERQAKVGDEAVYVVRKVAKDGRREIDHISTTSFLLLQRDLESTVDGLGLRSCRETFTDYRTIEGMLVPTRRRGDHAALGNYTARVRDVRYV